MPPETESVKQPEHRTSPEAMLYLESFGLVDRQPMIRSSDYRMTRSCPFTYYLCRRLGLVKALQYSEALSRGTWVHHFFSFITLSEDDRVANCYTLLNRRLDELKAQLKAMGTSNDKMHEILHREETDFLVTKAWFEAALTVTINSDLGTLKEHLCNDRFIHVGQELLLKHGDCVAQPDLLLYDKPYNKLWIVDFKTCAGSPHQRLQMCPWEFQTQHYFAIAQHLMMDGQLQHALDIPSDCELGGVKHIAISKPTIKFGMADRPFTIDTTPLKSGPRKGEPKNKKVFTGEPHPDNYRERCIEWYHGINGYEHLQPERVTDPPVNISWTGKRTLLDHDQLMMYSDRLSSIRKYRNNAPVPGNFLVGDVAPFMGRISPYASFITNPVKQWPQIIESEGFIVRDRDDPNMGDGIHASFLNE